MWMEKIRRGVLAVHTGTGVRYVRPSLTQRLQLLWTFRNFSVLPEEVLNRHERTLVAALCSNGHFLANGNGNGNLQEYCIGIVERMSAAPPRKPAQRMISVQHPSGRILPRAN